MTRQKRHTRILELIKERDIATQTELANTLLSEGYAVTQATVSRDIKDLGLLKVATDNKGYKYFVPEKAEESTRHHNLYREAVLSIEKAMNVIVVKTLTGSANSACYLIDKMNIDGVVGTLAGDDTFVVFVKDLEHADKVYQQLRDLYHR